MIDTNEIKERLQKAREKHAEASANYRLDTSDNLAWENSWKAAQDVVKIEHELKDAFQANETKQKEANNEIES